MGTKSERRSGMEVQTTSSSKVESDSREAGAGSQGERVYVNERGEVCYDGVCVSLALDKERHEARVIVHHNPSCNVQQLVDTLKEMLFTGESRTVYEIENKPPSK